MGVLPVVSQRLTEEETNEARACGLNIVEIEYCTTSGSLCTFMPFYVGSTITIIAL